MSTTSNETDRYRRLLSGPVARFLDSGGDDPFDLVQRVEVIEATLRHWIENAAPYAGLMDEACQLIAELREMVTGLRADLTECHEEGVALVAALTARLDQFEARMLHDQARRTSRTSEIDALIGRADRWCEQARPFIADG